MSGSYANNAPASAGTGPSGPVTPSSQPAPTGGKGGGSPGPVTRPTPGQPSPQPAPTGGKGGGAPIAPAPTARETLLNPATGLKSEALTGGAHGYGNDYVARTNDGQTLWNAPTDPTAPSASPLLSNGGQGGQGGNPDNQGGEHDYGGGGSGSGYQSPSTGLSIFDTNFGARDQAGAPGTGPAGTGLGGLQRANEIPDAQNQFGPLGKYSIAGIGLNAISDYNRGNQQDLLADGGFGIQTGPGSYATVGKDGQVTGTLGNYSQEELKDYAASQGHTSGINSGVAGSLGGPSGFIGAGGANYPTAAGATSSLDAQDFHNNAITNLSGAQGTASAAAGGATGIHSNTGATINADGSFTHTNGVTTNVTDSAGNPINAPSFIQDNNNNNDDGGWAGQAASPQDYGTVDDFGGSGDDSSSDSGGTWCCTAAKSQGIMTAYQITKLRRWHESQSQVWRDGYDIHGKFIADNLVSRWKYFAKLTKAFYEWKVNKKFSCMAVQAWFIIYPASIAIGLYKKFKGDM